MEVNSTCPIMIFLTSLFIINLINPVKKIKIATQSCLTDHGQVAEQERSCHSFVCIAMSGRELASISMSHTHNCGNSSPFFCLKSYPWSVKMNNMPLWVTNKPDYGLQRTCSKVTWRKNLNFNVYQYAYIFHLFLKEVFFVIRLG